MSKETRTITEMVSESPDVDRWEIWEQFWEILSNVRDQVLDRFDLEPHPSTADYDSYTAGDFEGSLNTWSGGEVEWFVHSWLGNRSRSILDMNINIWLGPQVDVPHLVFVLGTVPKPYHYSDFIARRDLADDPDHVARYYEPENEHFLSFRADERFHWSVSHGTYMRTVLSPVGYSFMSDQEDGIVEEFRRRIDERFARWLGLVDNATPVPADQQAALRARDHRLRRSTYTRDPMNELAKNFMPADLVPQMVRLRYGHEQLVEVGSEAAT